MIQVTRLNGRKIVINADLIKYLEETPDTLVTLVSGDKLYVQENVEAIIRLALEYGRSLRCFPGVDR
ncbi:MAG: flagellar FlbD family protein [Planctomycetota bacterium]|jgi:flagellar protein FlbD